MPELDDLMTCDEERCPRFSLDGLCVWAKILDCYDGDTVTAVLPIQLMVPGVDAPPAPYCKWSVRLLGIDTPEMRSPSPRVRALAVNARDWLRERCKG